MGDLDLIPGSGRSPGEGNGSPLQYSFLENPMDRGAWWTTVHEVSKGQTQLNDEHFHFSLCLSFRPNLPRSLAGRWTIAGSFESFTDCLLHATSCTCVRARPSPEGFLRGCPGEPNHADTGLGWRDSAAEERAWCPVGLVEFDLTPTGVQQLQVKSADALLWM